jgi:FkbM family methyltransferase
MLNKTTAYGLEFLYPKADRAVGLSLARHGEFARVELEFLIEHATGDAGVFLDVGANIGAIALPFAKARPSWKVIAFEAHAGLAGVLAANAINNGAANVEVSPLAVGRGRAVADFPATSLAEEGNFGAHGFGMRGGPTRPVGMAPLDDFATPEVRLVKVDVEGFEPEVLAGARRLLAEIRPTWLMETSRHNPQATRATLSILKAAGYRLFWFFTPFAVMSPHRGAPVANPGQGDMNVIALPEGAESAWPLPPVDPGDDIRPLKVTHWPYLSRYGYPPA